MLLDKGVGRPVIVLRDIRPWDAAKFDLGILPSEVKRLSKNQYDVYTDGIPDRAIQNIRIHPQVKGPETIAIYRGANLDTRGAELATLAQHFGFAFHTAQSPAKEANVIVVTAHKNSDYRNYLMNLSKSGALNGKMVLLASCASTTDAAFVSELFTRGGAPLEVIRFSKEIDPAHAVGLVKEVGNLIKRSPQKEFHLERLLDEAFDTLSRSASTDAEKKELDELRHFIVQVS